MDGQELIPSAPRVRLADIEAAIGQEIYFTGSEGAFGTAGDSAVAGAGPLVALSLDRLTVCLLVMRNGYTVVGNSACVSPRNFDAETGRKVARGNAVDQCWALFGFALADRLYREDQAQTAAADG